MRFAAAAALLLTLVIHPSCASSTGAGLVAPEVQANKGLVVFYRPKSAKGAAIRFEITDGSSQLVGGLSNGTMIYEYVDPGQKTYRVRAPSLDGQDSVTLDVVSGVRYFVRGKILWGWPAGRPKFERASEEQALVDLNKL